MHQQVETSSSLACCDHPDRDREVQKWWVSTTIGQTFFSRSVDRTVITCKTCGERTAVLFEDPEAKVKDMVFKELTTQWIDAKTLKALLKAQNAVRTALRKLDGVDKAVGQWGKWFFKKGYKHFE